MLTGYPPVIEMLVILSLCGVGLWVLAQITMDDTIRRLIRVVVIVIVCVYVIFFLATMATTLIHSGGVPARR
jgi:hypothetical protein